MEGGRCFYLSAVITILVGAHVWQSYAYRPDYSRQQLESGLSSRETEDDTPSLYDAEYEGLDKRPLYRRLWDQTEFQTGKEVQRSKRQCVKDINCQGYGKNVHMICDAGACKHRCARRTREYDGGGNNFLKGENQKERNYYGNWRRNLISRQKRRTCIEDHHCGAGGRCCVGVCAH